MNFESTDWNHSSFLNKIKTSSHVELLHMKTDLVSYITYSLCELSKGSSIRYYNQINNILKELSICGIGSHVLDFNKSIDDNLDIIADSLYISFKIEKFNSILCLINILIDIGIELSILNYVFEKNKDDIIAILLSKFDVGSIGTCSHAIDLLYIFKINWPEIFLLQNYIFNTLSANKLLLLKSNRKILFNKHRKILNDID